MISADHLKEYKQGFNNMVNEDLCDLNIKISRKNYEFLKIISQLKKLNFEVFIKNSLEDLAEIYRNEIIIPF